MFPNLSVSSPKILISLDSFFKFVSNKSLLFLISELQILVKFLTSLIASPKPTIPKKFSVPDLKFFSWPPPIISAEILFLELINKAPIPVGPPIL